MLTTLGGMWWFLLAFVLLVAVLILLRLDAAKRSGAAPRARAPEIDDGGQRLGSGTDDDEVDPSAQADDLGAEHPEQPEMPEHSEHTGQPEQFGQAEPFENAGPSESSDEFASEASDASDDSATTAGPGAAVFGGAAAAAGASAVVATGMASNDARDSDNAAHEGAVHEGAVNEGVANDGAVNDGAVDDDARAAGAPGGHDDSLGVGSPADYDDAAESAAFEDGTFPDDTFQDDTVEPATDADDPDDPDQADHADHADHADDAEESGSSMVLPAAAAGAGVAGLAGAAGTPKLTDRVRKFLHGRKPNRGPVAEPQPELEDPLADSPVVRWLEERDFAPTPTPAPDFRHGDFAGGLPALGTVSHGMFRGRRALMGVAGGRAVLALQRDTASDVVLDLSRPDVDGEPGFHDAGDVAVLEARTSDYGRLELVDRDRLADAVRDLPSDVRRVWAESEWLAATVDSANNPSTWDDTVMALHEAATVLAPLPPVGGRARPLPAEIDPGSPGAASGPDADPSGGIPEPAGWPTPETEASATGATDPMNFPAEPDDDFPEAADDSAAVSGVVEADDGANLGPAAAGAAGLAAADVARRSGHLRLVPDRNGDMRDLSDEPVVADRGDAQDADNADSADDAEPAEPDPFAEIMEPTDTVPSRGDVAADHLEPRPPLTRPTRGTGHTYPEDASVPPLAAGVNTGSGGIKPLGSEDDEDEIRSEVERFDAARIDGGSDLDTNDSGRHSSGRHAGKHEGEVPEWLRSELATPREGGRRRRRAEPDTDADAESDAADSDGSGSERPGAEPDVEQTMRIQLPPDVKD